MRPERNLPLLGALAGMELCWCAAWAQYTTAALFARTFPVPLAGGLLVAALFFTDLSRGRGWRVIQVLTLQAAGLAAAALLMVYVQERPSLPLWNLRWIEAFWLRPRGALQWLEGVAGVFWAAVFWMGGVFLARRTTAHRSVCARFDVGVLAFFALFIMTWLVQANGGHEFGGSANELFLGSYFAFALLAVGLARIGGTGPTRFSAGRRRLGLLLGVAAGVVLSIAAVTLLFLPQLTVVAERTNTVLRRAASPFESVFLGILTFLFSWRGSAPKSPAGSPQGGLGTQWGATASPAAGGWDWFAEAVLKWGLVALIASLVLVVGAWGAWKLIQWLLSRTPARRESVARDRTRWPALRAVVFFLLACAAKVLRWRRRGDHSAAQVYAGLRRWGLRGGVAPVVCETPLEYAERLTRHFPSVRREVDLIVGLHVQEIYAGRVFEKPQLVAASRARGKLSSPLLWPRRLRSWFFPLTKSLSGQL